MTGIYRSISRERTRKKKEREKKGEVCLVGAGGGSGFEIWWGGGGLMERGVGECGGSIGVWYGFGRAGGVQYPCLRKVFFPKFLAFGLHQAMVM